MNTNEIVTLSNELNFSSIFSDNANKFLNNLSRENNTSLEFLVCPLITGIAHFISQSNVSALKTLKTGFSTYTALIAEPATGKSPAMNIIRNILTDIDEFEGVTPKDSHIVNSGTVEALVFYLEKYRSIISFFDESSQFLGAFGRYSGGGAYDRGIYLQLVIFVLLEFIP